MNGAYRRLRKIYKDTLRFLKHYGSWMSFLQTVAYPLNRLPHAFISAATYLSPPTRILSGIGQLLKAFDKNPEILLSNRIASFAGGITSITFAILSLAIPALGLTFAVVNVCSNTVVFTWRIITGLYDRYRGKWRAENDFFKATQNEFYTELAHPQTLCVYQNYKLTNTFDLNTKQLNTCERLKNLEKAMLSSQDKLRNKKKYFSEDVNDLAMSILTLAGLVMIFFPPTLIPAECLLLGVSVYGMLYKYNFPFKFVTKLENYFFGPQISPAVNIEDLEKTAKNYQPKLVSQVTSWTHEVTLSLKAKKRSSPALLTSPDSDLSSAPLVPRLTHSHSAASFFAKTPPLPSSSENSANLSSRTSPRSGRSSSD